MKIFSERLRELREEKQLSMLALAKKIGVSDAAVCKWENGTNEPKASYILLLANFFEVTTDYLLGLENEIGFNTFSAPQKNTTSFPADAQELVDIYLALESEYQAQILQYARYFADRRGIKKKKA